MANYWMIPRSKRSLVSLPLVLSLMAASALDREWTDEISLDFERRLEQYHLKRPGARRDQSGGGARTYRAMMNCLGVIFCENDSKVYRLTRAGERMLNGESPSNIVRCQLLKLQYPSVYSTNQNVAVNERFRVHPFYFLLSLLMRPELSYLTQEEIALFVVTEGTSDSVACIEETTRCIQAFRQGNFVVPPDFAERFRSRAGARTAEQTVRALQDIANTFINYMEYAQLAARDEENRLCVIDEPDAQALLSQPPRFNRHDPHSGENFQRSYGLGPGDTRDNRHFGERNVQPDQIAAALIAAAFHNRANINFVHALDNQLVREIAIETGLHENVARRHLQRYSGREREILASAYVAMAYAGRDEATEFELATTNLLGQAGFGFNARHIGGPSQPDIHVDDPTLSLTGIVDTKAYAHYSISNDHHNRMAHNYVPYYRRSEGNRLGFIMYVSGGFSSTFTARLRNLATELNLGAVGLTAVELLVVAERAHNGQTSAMRQRLVELATERRQITRHDFDVV